MLLKTRLIQAIWFAGDVFRPFFTIFSSDLASSFPLDSSFGSQKGQVFFDILFLRWPLNLLCKHTFFKITTPPRACRLPTFLELASLQEYEFHFTNIWLTFVSVEWIHLSLHLPGLENLIEIFFHGLFSEQETSEGTPRDFVH